MKFSKIYLLIADHSFQIFLKDIGYITTIFLYYGYITTIFLYYGYITTIFLYYGYITTIFLYYGYITTIFLYYGYITTIFLYYGYITTIFLYYGYITTIFLYYGYITTIFLYYGYITTIFLYYGYIFLKDIGYITTSTNSHIRCIVCICVSFLYICLTSETLHYPWIPSFTLSRCFLLRRYTGIMRRLTPAYIIVSLSRGNLILK